MFGIELN